MLLELIWPKEKNQNILEMEGMPPAYIVVDIRWDDPEDELIKDEIENKIEETEENIKNEDENKIDEPFQNYWMTNTPFYTQRYSSWPENCWHWTIGNCFLDQIYKYQVNQERLCIANVEGSYFTFSEVLKLSLGGKEDHLILKKIAVISGLLTVNPLETCRLSSGGVYMWGDNNQEKLSSSFAEHNTELTKNTKGIWYILAGKFNLFLANSAFGVVVVISLAFVNVQDIIHETKDYDSKLKGNNWRKVKRKKTVLPALKTNKPYHFSQPNEEEPASGAATTPTQAY